MQLAGKDLEYYWQIMQVFEEVTENGEWINPLEDKHQRSAIAHCIIDRLRKRPIRSVKEDYYYKDAAANYQTAYKETLIPA